MITYLLDTSALWHLFRKPGALRPWEGHIAAGVFHICEPTRVEFLYSAMSPAHRDELAEELDDLCRTQRGQRRPAGAIDLLVRATVVHHGHTVLHGDNDFATVAAVLKGVPQRDVRA
ncbi:VapC toxin family PIN domain ribonuclease [Streptomyces sp. NPDC093795]|uniref:VapC toxin family PIN domain ribonuclease n=1 Tax=Streptomyces sp. NPDC093795 TaxID=3366051 RepID=UPI003819187E